MLNLFAEFNQASGLSILEANFPRAIFVALGAIPGALSRSLLYWLGSPILGFICVEAGIFFASQML